MRVIYAATCRALAIGVPFFIQSFIFQCGTAGAVFEATKAVPEAPMFQELVFGGGFSTTPYRCTNAWALQLGSGASCRAADTLDRGGAAPSGFIH